MKNECLNLKIYPMLTIRDSLSGNLYSKIDFHNALNDNVLSSQDLINNISLENYISKYEFKKVCDAYLSNHNSDIKNLTLVKKSFVKLPCGKCINCLKSKSSEWALRLQLELLYSECDNYFVTLTYDDIHKKDDSLHKIDIQNFNKKLKIYLKRKNLKSDFRFFASGEYGDNTKRPHYHIIYFGLPLFDKKLLYVNSEGMEIYQSDFLENVWSKGFVYIGSVSDSSIYYVAGYCLKKLITSDINSDLESEFRLSSRMPGIGFKYLEDNKEELLKDNHIYLDNGRIVKMPDYFKRKLNIKSDIYKDFIFDKQELEINDFNRYSDSSISDFRKEKNENALVQYFMSKNKKIF